MIVFISVYALMDCCVAFRASKLIKSVKLMVYLPIRTENINREIRIIINIVNLGR